VTGQILNHELEALMAGAELSHAALARNVNHLGGVRYGLRLAYDYRSVGRWLRGAIPDPPAPELIAAALSHALGRPIEPHHLGFAKTKQARQSLALPATAARSVAIVTGLWKDAINRRAMLHGSAAFAAALALEAAVDWRFAVAAQTLRRDSGTAQVTSEDVDRLYAACRQFRQLDHANGGGYALAAIEHYLHTEVSPLLAGRYSSAVGHDLFRATAMLAEVAAWMAMDAGYHGLAQRCYTQAAGLACHAGDVTYGALVTEHLATQALFLGHTRTAVRLARIARDGGGRAMPAPLTARIAVTEARAHALLGDVHETMRMLRIGEQAMDRAIPASDPEWLSACTRAHFAGSAMHALRDLGRHDEATRYAADALDLPPENARTRALHTVLLASVLAAKGDLDGATETAQQVDVAATTIRSRRLNERLNEFAARLAPYRAAPVVADYLRDDGQRSVRTRNNRTNHLFAA
jgi:cytochrome c551/c552